MDVVKTARQRAGRKLGIWCTLIPLTALGILGHAAAFAAGQVGAPSLPFLLFANVALASQLLLVPYRILLGRQRRELIRRELCEMVRSEQALQRCLWREGGEDHMSKMAGSMRRELEAEAASHDFA